MSSISNKTPSIWGGTLLVIGNVIGAGILAMPIAIAQLGLIYAIIVLVCFWFLMTLGAYYVLEANLALPPGSNLISMSRTALGRSGAMITWVCNLLVMYSLISAYIAGGGDLIKINFNYLGTALSAQLSSILFVLIFGFIVSLGMHITDHTNRILMLIKSVVFITTVIGLAIHINPNIISIFSQKKLSASLLMIVITSFGFATLVPSLRSYYQSDVQKIKKIIFFGTLVPLLCYIIWITVIFSVIPYHGRLGLEEMSVSKTPVADLQSALSQTLHVAWITQATNIFSSICIITSFFANSISFTDFIADGLHLVKNNRKSWSVYLIVFLPSICAVLFYQKAFLLGLSIAGTLAIIQLLILPGLIVWFLRYSNKGLKSVYLVRGGKPLLVLLLIVSVSLLFLTIR